MFFAPSSWKCRGIRPSPTISSQVPSRPQTVSSYKHLQHSQSSTTASKGGIYSSSNKRISNNEASPEDGRARGVLWRSGSSVGPPPMGARRPLYRLPRSKPGQVAVFTLFSPFSPPFFTLEFFFSICVRVPFDHPAPPPLTWFKPLPHSMSPTISGAFTCSYLRRMGIILGFTSGRAQPRPTVALLAA